MDVSGMFSDDQMAVICCFGALAVCGMIAGLSFRFGPAGREQNPAQTLRNQRLPLQTPQNQTQHNDRRAA